MLLKRNTNKNKRPRLQERINIEKRRKETTQLIKT